MSDLPEILPSENPLIPEGINAAPHHPLRELTLLTMGAVGAFVLIGVLVWSSLTFGARFIPFSWEVRVSKSVSELFDGEASESDVQADLQRRLDRIVSQMDEQSDITLRVHYLQGDVVNAFATLGGHIFVFEGLLNVVKSDIGLDMVLAHEAAHVLNRDPIQAAAGAVGLQLLIALVTGNGDFAQVSGLMDMGSNMLLLSYSRDQERAADQRALETLSYFYSDLSGADELFVYIRSEAGEQDFPEFLSSHPNPEARIETIQKAISH